MVPDTPDAKPETTFEEFAKLDIRVGRILEVRPFERARNPSYKVAVDLGELGTRWSSAQITRYTPAELKGTLVACVCNMPARNVAGFRSEILILGALDDAGGVVLVSPRSTVPLGSRVF